MEESTSTSASLQRTWFNSLSPSLPPAPPLRIRCDELLAVVARSRIILGVKQDKSSGANVFDVDDAGAITQSGPALECTGPFGLPGLSTSPVEIRFLFPAGAAGAVPAKAVVQSGELPRRNQRPDPVSIFMP